jgi:lipopolysaccharide transport system permease protein
MGRPIDRAVTVITPARQRGLQNLREIWTYRELLFFFAWRDLKVRYKQTVIGALWAILQPFFAMVVFSVVFGHFVGVPSDGLPYPIFSYCGLLPWNLFSKGMSQAANSTVSSGSLFTRVYFPRILVPTASVLTGLVDFAIAFVVLIGMMVFYRIHVTWNVVWLPLYVLIALSTALGVGFWLSSLNVRFRDVRYVLGFLTSFWLYATPVIYPSSLVGRRFGFLVDLNPLSGVVEGFRWALLGTGVPPGGRMFALSITISLTLLVSGLLVFRRMERTFADVM